MSKLVVLNLGIGNFEQGFQNVTLQIWEERNSLPIKFVGKLPPSPEIPRLYDLWQFNYRGVVLRPRIEAVPGQVKNISVYEVYTSGKSLEKRLKDWLRSEAFRPIKEELFIKLKQSEEIHIIIETEDPQLRRLPWHLWDFFERYSKAEVALSAPAYDKVTSLAKSTAKARIMVILGNSSGIDVQADRRSLENLLNAEMVFLVEPSRQELENLLWDKRGWDIIFFAGHSSSKADGTTGEIYINANDSLTIPQLNNALKKAIERGLKIAFFNSCDGLGIAQELLALQIPQIIVMREPVPDLVAQEFLKYFLQAFSRGESLYLAVREARERLQVLEEQFPSATWLPVLFQNPAVSPVTWREISSQGLSKAVSTTDAVLRQPIAMDNPEGQVSLDSRFYVERPPIEADCYETILYPGALIRIKAPRQMGKTSLMTRILHHASQQGHQTASLNFQSADGDFLTNLDQFLQWFCASITYELNLPDKLADYWKGVVGSKNKCTNYFQRYLLSEITSPLALGLDEVDQVFQHPQIATDFFGLLRAWHEKGKNEANWKKLRLVIVHSKEVYVPLNINQSPFNVGLAKELPELNSVQVQDLVKRHGLHWSSEQVEQIMVVFGGHPYLVRAALYEIARGRITLEKLLRVAPTEEGPYYDHLRRHLLNLENDVNLVTAIKQVVAASEPVQIGTVEAFKLRSMGLVKFQGNAVMPLCNLYRQYFRDRLGVSR